MKARLTMSKKTDINNFRNKSELPFALGGTKGTATTTNIIKLRARRRIFSLFVSFIGVTFVLIGGFLALSTQPVPAFQKGNTIFIGASELYKTSPGVYEGAGVAVFHTLANGEIRSAGSANFHGIHTTGQCILQQISSELINHCVFSIGGKQLQSTDIFRLGQATAWVRTYSNGDVINIPVPLHATIIPVPFPLGVV